MLHVIGSLKKILGTRLRIKTAKKRIEEESKKEKKGKTLNTIYNPDI